MNSIVTGNIIASFAFHKTGNKIDEVILSDCSAQVLLCIFGGKPVEVSVDLEDDELDLYQQLATKIENRVRRTIGDTQ